MQYIRFTLEDYIEVGTPKVNFCSFQVFFSIHLKVRFAHLKVRFAHLEGVLPYFKAICTYLKVFFCSF